MKDQRESRNALIILSNLIGEELELGDVKEFNIGKPGIEDGDFTFIELKMDKRS